MERSRNKVIVRERVVGMRDYKSRRRPHSVLEQKVHVGLVLKTIERIILRGLDCAVRLNAYFKRAINVTQNLQGGYHDSVLKVSGIWRDGVTVMRRVHAPEMFVRVELLPKLCSAYRPKHAPTRSNPRDQN